MYLKRDNPAEGGHFFCVFAEISAFIFQLAVSPPVAEVGEDMPLCAGIESRGGVELKAVFLACGVVAVDGCGRYNSVENTAVKSDYAVFVSGAAGVFVKGADIYGHIALVSSPFIKAVEPPPDTLPP